MHWECDRFVTTGVRETPFTYVETQRGIEVFDADGNRMTEEGLRNYMGSRGIPTLEFTPLVLGGEINIKGSLVNFVRPPAEHVQAAKELLGTCK